MTPRIQSNPVLAHLTRRSGWHLLSLTVGLSLVSLLVAASQMAMIPDLLSAGEAALPMYNGRRWGYPELPRAIVVETEAIRALFVLAPLIAACAAAVVTGRYLRSDEFKMLFATPMASGVIAQGLVFTALYRLRALLALMMILTPVLVIRPYFDNQKMARYGCSVFISSDEYRQLSVDEEALYHLAGNKGCVEPADNRLLLKSLVDVVLPTVVWWGVTLLGVTLGVTLMLAWHRVEAVVLFVVTVPLILVLVLALVGPQIGPRIGWCTVRCTQYFVWPPEVGLYDVIGWIAPYALALGITWISRFWVRKPA